MNSAGEKAYVAAQRARESPATTVASSPKEHPIRIAVTLGVIAWWMLRGRSHSTDPYYSVFRHVVGSG